MLGAILSKYLLNALLIALVSIGYGFLKNKLGEDRASTIKEAILKDKNISLRKNEEKAVKTMMKANVGKINQQSYDFMLKKKLIEDKGIVQQSLMAK
jgi:hypothetical protein